MSNEYTFELREADVPFLTELRLARAENARLQEALARMIYETTHLSPMEDDGSHKCTISGSTLNCARAALKSEEKPIVKSSQPIDIIDP